MMDQNALCTIDECGRSVQSLGLCRTHYLRKWKYGDPNIVKVPRHLGSLRDRYEARVEKNAEGCWGWKGAKAAAGYGHIRYQYRIYQAHRLSFEFHNGPIPEGMDVCHRCDNPTCTKPDHLFIGTASDNMLDAYQKGRRPNIKITPEQAKEIQSKFGTGLYTKVRLAKEYNVTTQAIRDALRSK
jgi:HNH endonuclease